MPHLLPGQIYNANTGTGPALCLWFAAETYPQPATNLDFLRDTIVGCDRFRRMGL